MAPPTTRARLSGLDPDDVALEVALAVFRHTQELVQTLLAPAYAGVSDEPQVEALCRQTHIYEAVRSLAMYAVTGLGGPGLLANVQRLLTPLWARVCGDREGAMQAVICAASARDRIAAAEPVDAVQLAALGDVSATHIRWLSRSGDLTMRDGKIAAIEARRWLATRRVPGYSPEALAG